MSLLTNPLVLRAGLLLFGAMAVFGLSLFLMRQLRKNLLKLVSWLLTERLVSPDLLPSDD